MAHGSKDIHFIFYHDVCCCVIPFLITIAELLFLFYDCSGSCYNICLSDCVLLLVFSILETWLQLLVKSLVAKFVLLR